MEANDLSQVLGQFIPTAGATKAISVGFENVDALVPLRIILDDYLKKSNEQEKKLQQEENKQDVAQQKKLLDEWSKLFMTIMKEQKTKLETISKKVDDEIEESKKIVKATEEKNKKVDIKENKDDFKEFKAFAKRFLSASVDVLKKHLDNAVELGNVYTDIESNGVFLSNGFKDLGTATNKLGMTHQELANHLKKTSPLIAKLNGSMGNGLKSFESAISGIDDKLNLTNKEKVAIFENVISNLSPDQLLKMTQEQMNMEINKTAKEMKMLSMATGKAVDLINQENAQKEATQRQQVWKRTHQASFNVLKALGLDKDQEMMDYIMSGGTKATANIITRMQNDPFMQKVLPQMIRMANTNQLNMGTAANLYNQNKHLVGYKSAYANKAAFDPAMMAAASSSDYFQNVAYNDTFGEAFMKMNLNGDMASQYYGSARADANSALGNHIGLTRAMGRYDAAKLEALSGGEQGVSNATLAGSKLYNAGAWGINAYNNTIGKIPFIGGTLAGLGASTIAVNKEQIFSAAVDRFATAVNIFAGSELFKSFGGNTFKSLIRHPLRTSKVIGKNILKSAGKVGGTLKGGAKLAGKVIAPVVSLAETGGVLYDMATKGVSNTYDDYKKNWGGWDWINPSKLATVGGGWLGDKIGGWLFDKSPEERMKKVKEEANKKFGAGLKTPLNSEIKSSNIVASEEASIQTNKDMLQCMKDTNKKLEELCYINEEQKNVMFQTRIDKKTTGNLEQ